MDQLTIRMAKREDAATLIELIRDLAIFEKEPESAQATVADIERDGFGEHPLFRCYLAEWDGRVAGFALFFVKWSTWTGRGTLHLEDLFVRPRFRGKSIGKLLLRKLAALAVESGYQRFEWEVLDWNMTARDFYHKFGAYHREGWYPYRVEGQALRDLAGGE